MSQRRKKHYAKTSSLEPTNLSLKKYYEDENSNSSNHSEATDSSEMPAENFLKLQWNSENSSIEVDPLSLKTKVENDEDEIIEGYGGENEESESLEVDDEGEDVEVVGDYEENDLYVNYSLLTDHLISGHFLSGATAEEVYVYNEEATRSTKVVTDILCDKFKCHYCNLSFLSHMFYKNHLKKCLLRRSLETDGQLHDSNTSDNSIDINSKDIVKRKSLSQISKNNLAKVRKSHHGQLHQVVDEASDNSIDCEELDVDDIIQSGDNLNFKCDSCKGLFTSFNEMKDHVCFKNTEHQCDMCLKKCPTKAAFYEHLERSHKIKINNVLSAPPSKQFPVVGNVKRLGYNNVISNGKTNKLGNHLRPYCGT